MAKTSIGISYNQQVIEDNWDAIVIGSGIGGLTAAALLSKHGRKRVLVLERHYVAGGFTHVFHRPGYEWDVGVHYIGNVDNRASPIRAAFDHLTETRLQWNRMPDVYDRIIIAGRVFDYVTGGERLQKRLKEYFPAEKSAIDKYFEAVRACIRASQLYYAEKAIPRFLAHLAGSFMRASFLRWASRTTREVLKEITHNPELIGVLTGQWGDYGLPPAQSSFAVHATIAEHYFEGASYPIGGAGQIASAIAPVIERNGGKIVVGAKVGEILLEASTKAIGVRMQDGREFRASIVVSDAGASNTFGSLIPNPTPAIREILSEIRKIPPSMAYLCLYVGLKETATQLGLEGTNLWIHPTADHDANLAGFEADSSAPFPVLFISFPSAKDPDFQNRNPGRATIEVITPAPYDSFRKWEDSRWKHRGEEYESFKQCFTRRLVQELEAHVPTVAGKIDYAELSTPLSTRHFMNYPHGEAYGLGATPARFQLRQLGSRSPIQNLYLSGQDVVSLGVAGAMFGGIVTASAILRRNIMRIIAKGPRGET